MLKWPVEAIDWHDTTLLGLHADWKDGTCIIDLRHGTLGNCKMTFAGLVHLDLPRERPWGCSVSIQGIGKSAAGDYEIALQSGDVIRIAAADVVFKPGLTPPR